MCLCALIFDVADRLGQSAKLPISGFCDLFGREVLRSQRADRLVDKTEVA
jgi:hypothetical protein